VSVLSRRKWRPIKEKPYNENSSSNFKRYFQCLTSLFKRVTRRNKRRRSYLPSKNQIILSIQKRRFPTKMQTALVLTLVVMSIVPSWTSLNASARKKKRKSKRNGKKDGKPNFCSLTWLRKRYPKQMARLPTQRWKLMLRPKKARKLDPKENAESERTPTKIETSWRLKIS
jgi:hypothetical protein